MTAVLLSAGRATRLGGRCKALVEVGGRTMIEHWSDRFDDLLVVCRAEHVHDVQCQHAWVVPFDEGGGPARALDAALPHLTESGLLTVIYADTYVSAPLPAGIDWTGVAAAQGGRPWYVAEHGGLDYRNTHPSEVVLAGVGLFRFSDLDRLRQCLHAALDGRDKEVGMDAVHNLYAAPFAVINGWQDVGTEEALTAWRPR